MATLHSSLRSKRTLSVRLKFLDQKADAIHHEFTECSAVSRQRNITLDIAKGIGIVFVVVGHNPMAIFLIHELFLVIFSFHIPLFFFLSGIFLHVSDKPRHFILSKFDSLLKPYFSVMLLLCITKIAQWSLSIAEKKPNVGHDLVNILYGTGDRLSLGFGIAWSPLWFVPHLFISSATTWAIIRILKVPALIAMYALASLITGVFIMPSQALPWSIDLIPITSAFLACGYLSRHLLKSPIKLHAAPILLALTGFTALHYFFNETIDLNRRIYGQFFICTTQAFLGIYICLIAATVLGRFWFSRQLLSYIGSCTLFIMFFHWLFQGYVFDVLLNWTHNLYITAIGSILAGISLPIAMFEITKRSYFLSALLLQRKLIATHTAKI